MNKRMNKWMNGWVNEWKNEGMNEWTNIQTNGWVNELMNGWMNEWTDGWMNEWMNSDSLLLLLLLRARLLKLWKHLSLKGLLCIRQPTYLLLTFQLPLLLFLLTEPQTSDIINVTAHLKAILHTWYSRILMIIYIPHFTYLAPVVYLISD
jgi:hypothetical protein